MFNLMKHIINPPKSIYLTKKHKLFMQGKQCDYLTSPVINYDVENVEINQKIPLSSRRNFNFHVFKNRNNPA
ncbi:MAG: hypothetical protein FWH07_04460 [Oscillospiraceae bacterium]|nr:hypothetical protein [Oscillospiraceae bacterium]